MDNDGLEVLPLKEWRLRKYMSIRGMAAAAGVSKDAYKRAERGHAVWEVTQRRIADALGIKVEQVEEFVQGAGDGS